MPRLHVVAVIRTVVVEDAFKNRQHTHRVCSSLEGGKVALTPQVALDLVQQTSTLIVHEAVAVDAARAAPSSLDFACDCFFVFSLTFVLCNFLHMCREFAAGLYTLCTNTFSVRIRGPRGKICATRNFDIYHKNGDEKYGTL